MHLTVLLPSLINRGYTQVSEIIFTQHPPNIGTLKKKFNKSCPNLARFQSAAKQVWAPFTCAVQWLLERGLRNLLEE